MAGRGDGKRMPRPSTGGRAGRQRLSGQSARGGPFAWASGEAAVSGLGPGPRAREPGSVGPAHTPSRCWLRHPERRARQQRFASQPSPRALPGQARRWARFRSGPVRFHRLPCGHRQSGHGWPSRLAGVPAMSFATHSDSQANPVPGSRQELSAGWILDSRKSLIRNGVNRSLRRGPKLAVRGRLCAQPHVFRPRGWRDR